MSLTKISIFLLWIAAVVDPIGNFFYLRYIAMSLSFTALIWLLATGKIISIEKSFRLYLIGAVAILMPLYGMILYSFRGGGADFVDTSYISSGLLILFSLLYRDAKLCNFGLFSLVFSLRVLCFIILAGFVSQVTLYGDWISYFTEKNVALVSFREYAGISVPYIYFLASPMLIFLLAHDLACLKIKPIYFGIPLLILTTLAFMLSGTRAHIIIAMVFVPLYFILIGGIRMFLNAGLLMIVLASVLIMHPDIRMLLASFFSTEETSNSMKLALLHGYYDIFANPLYLIFGQGFNAHEWSAPLRNMIAMEDGASKTELTYIELIRVFGLVVTGVFLIVLIPMITQLRKLSDDLIWLYPGFVIFLINASLNPYLFSTNGMLPLGLAASCLIYRRYA